MINKSLSVKVITTLLLSSAVCFHTANAQFNSGSNGSDGAFNPSADIAIDMADHPDGIYQYTTVNIPSGIDVTFKPNLANTPVVWLVQGDCIISGTIHVEGDFQSGAGGPGGGRGGEVRSAGMGPGAGYSVDVNGGYASFATLGRYSPGSLYGNEYLIPLLGGSGGGGSITNFKGGGGGGAILIACTGTLTLNGTVNANSGGTGSGGSTGWPGDGSGGSVRLVSSILAGSGSIQAASKSYSGYGKGRVRLEAFSDLFTGSSTGVLTRGMQSILMLPENLNPHMRILSIGGVLVPAIPLGSLPEADAIIPGTLSGPFEITVECQNIPLNTQIKIDIKPQQASPISVAATNSSGTFESSIANASVDIPVGGGRVVAQAVITIPTGEKKLNEMSYRDTGLTTSGERFVKAELSSVLGERQQMALVTESGERILVFANN